MESFKAVVSHDTACPILELVRAKYYSCLFHNGCEIFPAVIKRYIGPRSITQEDVNKLMDAIADDDKAYSALGCDIRADNIGKTANGRLYLLDTQLEDYGY